MQPWKAQYSGISGEVENFGRVILTQMENVFAEGISLQLRNAHQFGKGRCRNPSSMRAQLVLFHEFNPLEKVFLHPPQQAGSYLISTSGRPEILEI